MSAEGRIASIWRYPVKSMAGEELPEAEITTHGLQGDRAIALVDVETGKIVSAKNPRKWPRLLYFRARIAEPATGLIIMTCPDGEEMRSDDPQNAKRLSKILGRQVVLQTIPVDHPILESSGPGPASAIVDEAILAGSFFDAAPIHLVTTSTLRQLAALHPGGLFDIRRFRPNIVINSGERVGFVENSWIGRTLILGDHVRLQITAQCPRCVMTTLDQPELRSDASILGAVVKNNGGTIGVYATVLNVGAIRRGDCSEL